MMIVDDLAGDEVRQAEEGAGDDDEAYGDRCGLADLPTIRPLYSLQLAPASSQEGRRGGRPRAPRSRERRAAARAHELGAVLDVAVAGRRLLERLPRRRRRGPRAPRTAPRRRARQVDGGVDRRRAGVGRGRVDQLGAADLELRLGEVDLAARELRRLAGSCRCAPRRCVGRGRRRATVGAACLSAAGRTCLAVSALLRSSAVAGHDRVLAQRVSRCAVCDLHQRQYLRSWIRSGIVALALVRLVVASLAVFARERDCDPNVSAGHGRSKVGMGTCPRPGGGQTTDRQPARATQCSVERSRGGPL